MPFGTKVLQIPLLLNQSFLSDVIAGVLMESNYPDNLLSALLFIIWTVELKFNVGDSFKLELVTAAFGALWVVAYMIKSSTTP
jgi:hypothetical protein